MHDKHELGERLKRFRLGRNLTLKEVELKAKVSATHISEIERGMTSPTVGALTKIARALGTEPAFFVQDDHTPPVSVVRKSRRHVLTDSAWGARLGRLCGGIHGSEISFLEIELDPGRGEKPEPVIRAGEEFVHVLRGVVEIIVGPDRYLLKEGDSVHFRASETHTLRNIGDGKARMLFATLPPFCL